MNIHTSAKREFLKWVSSLKSKNLNDTEKKFINLLIVHFDTISSLGTVKGQRAKKISNLIQTVGIDQSSVLLDTSKISFVGLKKSKSLVDLKIGPLRGFNDKRGI